MDDIIIYVENLKESAKKKKESAKKKQQKELISYFRKVVGCKINIQKSVITEYY